MKYIFLDTNIIIDFLANRKPFSDAASQIFSKAESGKIKLYISAISYNNIFYLLKKSFSRNDSIRLLLELMDLTEVVEINTSIIRKSLVSEFIDFEDAIQYNCALSLEFIDFIITRDINGFNKSIIPVISPEESLIIINNND